MIDQWLTEELEKRLKEKNRVVFLDPQGDFEFVLDKLKDLITYPLVISKEHLKTKYLIEKKFRDEPCVIYVQKHYRDLEYLAEYADTGSLFDSSLTEFIQEQLDLGNSLDSVLQAAAQLSVGKDISFWKNVQAKGKEGIFEDIDREGLKLLRNPIEFKKKLEEKDAYQLFVEVVREKYGIPGIASSPDNLAYELAKGALLSALNKEIVMGQGFPNLSPSQFESLEALYKKWLNSKSEESSLRRYTEELEKEIDWGEVLNQITHTQLGPDHPFHPVDEKVRTEYLLDKDEGRVQDRLLKSGEYIQYRARSPASETFGFDLWEVLSLLVDYFQEKDRAERQRDQGLDDLLKLYDQNIWRLDLAHRLSFSYGSERDFKKKVHQLYLNELEAIWEQWYKGLSQVYSEDHTGFLTISNILDSGKPAAVIVADAFRYEMAKRLTVYLENLELELIPEIAPIPTMTKTGMGALFSSGDFEVQPDLTVSDRETGELLDSKKSRIMNLNKLYGSEIIAQEFDSGEYPEPDENQSLLVFLQDVDSIGESSGLNALDYFENIIKRVADTIKTLLGIGYEQVYLISDHGFIIEDPEEFDKISTKKFNPKSHSDRFLICDNVFNNSGLIELTPPYFQKGRLHFPKGRGVFKKPSTYQFMHGGISPQEVIVPNLQVNLKERDDLEIFDVKISGEKKRTVRSNVFDVILQAVSSGQIFEKPRNFYLSLVDNGEEIHRSEEVRVQPGAKIKTELNLDPNISAGNYELHLLDAQTLRTEDSVLIDYQPMREGFDL